MLQWTIAALIRKINVNIDFSEHIRHAQLLSGLGVSEKKVEIPVKNSSSGK
jgi:hypothetical protein